MQVLLPEPALKGLEGAREAPGSYPGCIWGFPRLNAFLVVGTSSGARLLSVPGGMLTLLGGAATRVDRGWRDGVRLDGNLLRTKARSRAGGGDSPHGHVVGTSRCPPNARTAGGSPHLQVPVYQLVGLEVVVVFPKGVNDLLGNLWEGAGGRGSGTGTPSRDTQVPPAAMCPVPCQGLGTPRTPPARASPSASRRRRRTAAGWGGARTCPDPPPAPAPAAPGTAAR